MLDATLNSPFKWSTRGPLTRLEVSCVFDWNFFLCMELLCAGRKGGTFREHAQSSGTRPHSHGYSGDEGPQMAAAPRKKTHSSHNKVMLKRMREVRGRKKNYNGTFKQGTLSVWVSLSSKHQGLSDDA